MKHFGRQISWCFMAFFGIYMAWTIFHLLAPPGALYFMIYQFKFGTRRKLFNSIKAQIKGFPLKL